MLGLMPPEFQILYARILLAVFSGGVGMIVVLVIQQSLNISDPTSQLGAALMFGITGWILSKPERLK